MKAARSADQAKAAATSTLPTYQALSAATAANTMAAEAGRSLLTVPAAFAGETQLGFPIEYGISTIVDRAARKVQQDFDREFEVMMTGLDLLVTSEIIASGADATSVEIVMEPAWTNYVRVLDLPSCDRCVILAGRIYRDLDAFPRHPKCDCQHWPVESWAEAEAAGLVTDPEVAFERDQIKTRRWNEKRGTYELKNSLSVADMQAIRDGADIQEVVNAKRGGGRRPAGMTNAITAEIFGKTVKATLEGTTKRAEWRRKHPNLPIRLRPESIYEHAKDRDDAIRLLRLYGYIR